MSEQLNRIRDLPDHELAQALERARDELFRLKLGQHTNQVENPMTIRAKRREVARIMTVLAGRARGTETQGSGSASAAEAEGKDS